ncbi:MAG: diguanylate cyclase [Nitrospirae bacterium]|nr:diguanylate cyclase [Nitrospirota bacterium]
MYKQFAVESAPHNSCLHETQLTGQRNALFYAMVNKEDITFEQLLSSKEWADYFNSLSDTTNFEFNVYGETGAGRVITKENPFCNVINSAKLENLRCPAVCDELISGSLKTTEPVIFKCPAGILNFSFSIKRHEEKACVAGRGGFASYDDLREFLRLVKEKNLPHVPVTMPLSFIGEDRVKAVAQYAHLTLNRLLSSFDEKYRIEEKLLHTTALFDSHTFRMLSRNPELLCRYILDTLEYVFGKTTASFMALDRKGSTYNSVYSIGKYKEDLVGFQMSAKHPVIQEMLKTKMPMFPSASEELLAAYSLREIKSLYLFPIFIGDSLENMIVIFNKDFSREDLKIMNAFRDYVQLNLENQNLGFTINAIKKTDERLNYLADFSNSLLTVLSKEKLFNTLLEKALQLLNAEQGSLMLLDHDTSELVIEAKKGADEAVQTRMRLKKEESLAGRVLESGEPLLVEDIEKDPRVRRENRPHYKTKSFISIMIKIEDRVLGVLNVSDKIKGEAFNEEDLKLLQAVINNAAIAIERSLLYKQNEDLKQLSITDPLTGAYNRRYLNTRLLEEITRYNRYKHPFSFMMLDMDKFKEFNDTFGHIEGDKLIKALATIMEKSLRNVDIAARFGGDEFVAIFPQTTKADAIHITNRLKEKIDRALEQEASEMPLTISMGLTTYPDDASSIGELLEKTDQALYLAKRGGGNRVVYL